MSRASGASPRAVFVTGATGFIGGQLLVRLLADHPKARIYCLVRAGDDDETRKRGRKTIQALLKRDAKAAHDAVERVSWVRGDLTAPRFGISEEDRTRLASKIDLVIHSAASTEFDQTYEEAQPINVGGARNAIELAMLADADHGISRYVHVSTAYVAGRQRGRIRAGGVPTGASAFNNEYERSKAEAEELVRAAMPGMRCTIVRPSIVVGDARTGETSNFNVLYFPIRLAYRGALPILPILPGTTLDVVPVDYVCDATLALGRKEEAIGKTLHLTAAADAIPLHEMIEWLYEIYDRERAEVGQPPITRTKKVGPWKWWLIGLWLRLTLRGKARAAFDKFALFEPYLVTEKFFEDYETVMCLRGTGIERPGWRDYFERIVAYAVATGWGKREAPIYEGLTQEESNRRALRESLRMSGIRILGSSGVLSPAALTAASSGDHASLAQLTGDSAGSRSGDDGATTTSAEARFFATITAEERRVARERLAQREMTRRTLAGESQSQDPDAVAKA